MMASEFSRRTRFRLSLWFRARLLPFLVRSRPLDDVLRLADYRKPIAYSGLDAAYICQRVRQTTKRPWQMRDRRCLREGLLGFHYLKAAGFAPELRFGVDPASLRTDAAKAHCWVCLDGVPVLNDRLPGMIDIHSHPSPQTQARSEAFP